MTDISGILREPTTEEKKDFVNIGIGTHKSFDRILREKIDKPREKYGKLHEPFCGRCADFDIRDKVQLMLKEAERNLVVQNKMDWNTFFNKTINLDDESSFDEYADKKRFDFLKQREAVEKIRIGISHEPQIVGHHNDFRCKKRGCGISVFVPINYNKENNKEK